MTATLDALTDPVVSVNQVTRVPSVSSDKYDNAVFEDNSVTREHPGARINSGTRVNPVNHGISVPDVNPVTQGHSDPQVTYVVSDNLGNAGHLVTRAARKPGPPRTAEPRQHLKVRATLAEELRDAVSYMIDHGQPRTKLNEVIDQAVERWLAQAKKELMNGNDFPLR
jgi:hypothetical protein